MKKVIADILAQNFRAITGEPESSLIKVRVSPIRRTILYTSWRSMYRCHIHYRVGLKRLRLDIFAKNHASSKECEFHNMLWRSLPTQDTTFFIPRPLGFFSRNDRNIVLNEYVPGHNLNTILSVASLAGPHVLTSSLLQGWSRKAARWLTSYQAKYQTVDTALTAQQIDLARKTLERIDILPGPLKDRLDHYLAENSTGFLNVHRAPSLDFVARNLILSRGRLFLVDLEPRGSHDIFHNALEFCADLRAKSRYSFFARAAFDTIEQHFWKNFDSRGDEELIGYSKVLFSIHWLDYLLMARREFWKKSTPQWDAYIHDMAMQAVHWA